MGFLGEDQLAAVHFEDQHAVHQREGFRPAGLVRGFDTILRRSPGAVVHLIIDDHAAETVRVDIHVCVVPKNGWIHGLASHLNGRQHPVACVVHRGLGKGCAAKNHHKNHQQGKKLLHHRILRPQRY